MKSHENKAGGVLQGNMYDMVHCVFVAIPLNSTEGSVVFYDIASCLVQPNILLE